MNNDEYIEYDDELLLEDASYGLFTCDIFNEYSNLIKPDAYFADRVKKFLYGRKHRALAKKGYKVVKSMNNRVKKYIHKLKQKDIGDKPLFTKITYQIIEGVLVLSFYRDGNKLTNKTMLFYNEKKDKFKNISLGNVKVNKFNSKILKHKDKKYSKYDDKQKEKKDNENN